MKNISAEDIVNKKCEAIVSAVSSIGEEMNCAFLGCSVGAAVTIASNVDFDEMFRLVDAIMYSVKNNGGRNYKVMSETTDK